MLNPMLGRRLVLWIGLLLGTQVHGAGVRIESGPHDRTGRATVSWDLPAGFDESELLVEIEGGPRVRLTGEIRSRNPRVDVALPRLSGRARFVIRAGRDIEEIDRRGLEERDVSYSEAFTLGEIRTSPRSPVRAASTRPTAGHETEWWSESPTRRIEGPAAGMSASRLSRGAIGPDPLPLLRGPRPESQAASSVSSAARLQHPSRTSWPAEPLGSGRFSGTAVPLRN
jgi:hypothetical protein